MRYRMFEKNLIRNDIHQTRGLHHSSCPHFSRAMKLPPMNPEKDITEAHCTRAGAKYIPVGGPKIYISDYEIKRRDEKRHRTSMVASPKKHHR